MKHLTFCALLGLGMHMLGFGQTYTLTVESTEVGALPTAACTASTSIPTIRPTNCQPCSAKRPRHVVDCQTRGIYNDAFNSSWNASGINALPFWRLSRLGVRQLRHHWFGRSCGQHTRRRRSITRSRCRSDNDSEWVFQCRRHQLERQHLDRGVLVCVEHSRQRPA